MSSSVLDAPRVHFRVLLVEDNPGDADLVRESLQGAAGLEITHVETMAQARERLAADGADVVLLDLSLPDAIGLEGVAHLHDRAPQVPIVVLTSSRDEVLGARALQAGAQDYLVKGQADEWLLLRAMRYAVERQQLQAGRARLLVEEQAARAAAEAHQRRAAFLADVSLLLAGTLDDEQADATLHQVAALAVPRFADCCVVVRADSSPASQRVTVKHVVPEKEPLVRELYRGAPPDGGAALAPCSQVIATVEGHGEAIGTITFLYTAESGRRYSAEDQAMILDLARRMSLAAENVRLYREVRRAVGLREEFVSTASHELRTPLTALILQLDSLKLGVDALGSPAGAALVVKCGKVVKQAARLERLVDSLLDIARSSADHLTLECREMDLRELVRDVTDRFAEEATKVGCALTVRGGEPVLGSWDRLRVEQILTNLLSNALKYGQGKPVVVELSSKAGQAELTVRDHGIGLVRKDASRIFERFERAVSARQFGGLGLGLHIAREIARAHGGSIDVVSELGQGALFRVTLPHAGPARESQAEVRQ